ncbi:hypothetical protein K504DRAFT_454984 [Pleomassaria siparia CBS 279.74]|uniref:Apple domain-containing protein n=1 Tax=Pleomassaria siparia CBS 279.74 TaxID=1314801 RepID=A0A6G1K9W0_9PLEO|nr:hypothetical protein K504DRAFT_454984 [Pleomassaria siparia CBS 279.74]
MRLAKLFLALAFAAFAVQVVVAAPAPPVGNNNGKVGVTIDSSTALPSAGPLEAQCSGLSSRTLAAGPGPCQKACGPGSYCKWKMVPAGGRGWRWAERCEKKLLNEKDIPIEDAFDTLTSTSDLATSTTKRDKRSILPRGPIDNRFCGNACRSYQQCWVHYISVGMPTYACVRIRVRGRQANISTREEPSPTQGWDMIVDEHLCLNSINVGCGDRNEEVCWAHGSDSGCQYFYCAAPASAVIEGISGGEANLNIRDEPSPSPSNEYLCLAFNNVWCPDSQRACWMHSNNNGYQNFYCAAKDVDITLGSGSGETDIALTEARPRLPEGQCHPSCTGGEVCYLFIGPRGTFNTRCGPLPGASATTIDSAPAPATEILSKRDNITVADVSVPDDKCNPRCPGGRKCYAFIFSGVVIYYCHAPDAAISGFPTPTATDLSGRNGITVSDDAVAADECPSHCSRGETCLTFTFLHGSKMHLCGAPPTLR